MEMKELKKSYLVLIDGTEISFNATNTPLSNFYATAEIDGYYEVNGALVGKNDITEIVFGDDYIETMTIGDYFLFNCNNLTALNLSGLRNVEVIGRGFLDSDWDSRPNLTTLDLSRMRNLVSVGEYFLMDTELDTLIMGTKPPELGITRMNVKSLSVPEGTEYAYKFDDAWGMQADVIIGH